MSSTTHIPKLVAMPALQGVGYVICQPYKVLDKNMPQYKKRTRRLTECLNASQLIAKCTPTISDCLWVVDNRGCILLKIYLFFKSCGMACLR